MFDASRPDRGSIAHFRGHDAPSFYVKVAISPDGTHVMSGSRDGCAYIWQADRPHDPAYTLEGHTGEVTGVDWCSADFGRVASCSDDGTVRIWALKRRDAPQKRTLPPRRVMAVVPRADVRHVAAAACVSGAAAPPPVPAAASAPDAELASPVAAAAAARSPPLATTPQTMATPLPGTGRTLLVRTLTAFFTPSTVDGTMPAAASPPGRIRIALDRKKKGAGARKPSLLNAAAPAVPQQQ